MAGDWIKVEGSTPNKPEILRLSRLLGVTRHDAFGKAMSFWLWLDGVSVDGVVDGVTSTDIDAMVGADGFAVALESVGWLQLDDNAECVRVPNFENHNGETAKQRAVKSRRQSRWRNSKVAKPDRNVDAGVDSDVDGCTSTMPTTREEKRREEKSITHTQETREAAINPASLPGIEEWRQHLRMKLGRQNVDTSISAHLTQAKSAGWSDEKITRAITFSIGLDAKRLCDPDDDFSNRGREGPRQSEQVKVDLKAKVKSALAGAKR